MDQIRNGPNQKSTKSEMDQIISGPNQKWAKSEMDQNGPNQN